MTQSVLMIKHKLYTTLKIFLLAFICMPSISMADDIIPPTHDTETNLTPCATQAFTNQLTTTVQNISETDSEEVIQQWIYAAFTDTSTLQNVLNCPEVASIPDDGTITFDTVKYTFPSGRVVTVDYETQPKILKQRISLANKRDLPPSSPSARVGDLSSGDGTIWTNTDPAWYAIMVVENGTLREFVGADKNNTISLDYIIDNIDDMYPSGANCTSRSAFARDSKAINKAVTQTVDIEDDTNDYYVAGDVNLAWVGYAEIALDVAITVLTMGGGTVITGAAKSARASRALKGMASSLKNFLKLDTVQDYIKQAAKITKLQDEIKALDKVKDATKIADKTKELNKLQDSVKNLEKLDDVKKYKETAETYSDLNKYRRTLKGLKAIKQRGNIIARGVKVAKGAKAAMGGSKLINKGAKLGRASKLSAQVNDWLFHSTMKHAARLGKMETVGGAIYGGLMFVGKLAYDFTETSTGDFTNDIEFKPLLLLSADDIQQGDQADKINYGMWLMWAGDSTSPEDDDAAYLQAMDFAAKFHEDLMDVQNDSSRPCNVDIYVVKPILKNPGSDNPEIYYLIMNDEPWTTAE